MKDFASRLRRWAPRALGVLIGLVVAAGAHADSLVPVPTSSAAAIAFAHHREPLWLAAQLLPALIAFLVLFTRLGAFLRERCARVAGGNWFWTVTLFTCAYVIFAALVTLPFDYYRQIADLRAWGESDQTTGQWFAGEAVSLAVRLVVAALFVWIPYALIAKLPRSWWFFAAMALVPVAFLVLVALPVFVSPLTTHYVPLSDRVLAAKIETLAARCGVPHIPVFVGGDDDTVVGLGPTNRIILDADIFKNETPDQIEFTVGHELKHYIEGDNWKALAIIAGFLLVGFFLADRVGRGVIARMSRRIGFDDLADPASLPLIVLILSIFWLSVMPLFNLFARHIEHEADRFGLELTHQNHAAAELFAGFARAHLSTSEWDDFRLVFYATHPSNGDRVRFANSYRPWESGQKLVYGNVCRPAQR